MGGSNKVKETMSGAFRRKRVFLWGLGGLLGGILSGGCGGRAVVLPPHLKSVGIEPVENRTTEFGLEGELRRALVREFQADGRLALVPVDRADLSVAVRVKRYREEPLLLDSTTHRVLRYRISLDYDLEARDHLEDRVVVEERDGTRSVIYETSDFAGAVTETEEQARRRLAEEFSRGIVRAVMDGFR